MLTFRDIYKILTGNTIDQTGPLVTETVIDSRKVIPGSLFVALKGEKTDGHHYIEPAINQGANMVLIEQDVKTPRPIIDLRDSRSSIADIPSEPFCIRVDNCLETIQMIARKRRERNQLRVIGITGSVGKSSTKELVAEVLNQKYHTYKNPGNYNNEIGLPLTILNLGSGYERLVLEMGFFYPGEISFLCDIAKPDVGVITNIGTVHAERAGTQQAIADGKAELISALPAEGVAILNYDDPFVREMSKKTTTKVIYYGLDQDADIWADDIRGHGLKGISFDLHFFGKKVTMTVPILGKHSVQTILRACAVGFAEKMSWEEIFEGLIQSNTQLRLVAVQTSSGALILDDTYNATPESTIAALDLLKELDGQKIAVLGDMLELGPYELIGHQRVGEVVAKTADHLVAVGPLSKTIADTAKQCGLPATSITWVENAFQAVDVLKYNLREGDVVLIKGSHGLRMDRISALLEEVA